MAANYKLTYFNNKGRAELTRLLFAQAGVEYEDNRIEGSDWPTLKPSTPTGTLPILEIDGKIVVSQSQAISRYVAREFDLYGDNNLEMVKCDEVLEFLVDISTDAIPIFTEQDQDKKAELKKTIYEEKTKTKLKNLENMLMANGGEVFVGKKITLADIALLGFSTGFCVMFGDQCFNDFPTLTALIDKVSKEPKIAEWIAKRPVTPM